MTEEDKKKIREQNKQEMQATLRKARQELPNDVTSNRTNNASGADNEYGLSPQFMEQWRSYKTNKDRNTSEMIQALRDSDPYTPKTKYDEEKEAKRRKREGIIAAIGDGISALSNLYFTSRGALNAYDPKNSLSKAMRERWDRMDKRNELNRKNHVNTLMKINELQDAAGNEEMGWRKYFETAKAKRAAQEAAAAKAAADKEDKDRNFDFKVKKHEDDVARDKAKAAETAQYHKGQLSLGEERNTISRGREERLSGGGGSGGSGSKERYTIRLSDGSVREYNKNRIGALSSLAPTMKTKALAVAQRYSDAGNDEKAKHYKEIATQLSEKANTKETMAAIVAANVWDFPSMDADVRRMIGVGGGVAQKKSVQGFGAPKATPQKKTIVGFGKK